MTRRKKLKLAIVGTDSLRGKEIKTFLGKAKKWASFDVEFFDADVREEYNKLTQFKKEPKVIHAFREDALAGMDFIFLASDKETNRAYGEFAEKQKYKAVDLSETFNDRDDIPLIVAGVNDDLLRRKNLRLIANPHPVTIILSHLFHLIHPAYGIAKVVAFILQPVSAFDDAGIQELASQSVALLNGQTPAKKVFKEQIAFNILSHTEKPDDHGFCTNELQIAAEIKRVLEMPNFPLALSVIQAPVFHTYSLMTYLELERDTEIKALEALFKENKMFLMTPFRETCTASSISVAGKDKIFVGQIKKEESLPRTFWVWLVADNLTRGSALNAFEIAKKLLEEKPN
jgi:aspartate-semialdehyde dehydrogenase